MHVFTGLIVMSEGQTPDNMPTPINLSVIIDEKKS
jgi:hypothetical protein